jgi:hypothetical protein
MKCPCKNFIPTAMIVLDIPFDLKNKKYKPMKINFFDKNSKKIIRKIL